MRVVLLNGTQSKYLLSINKDDTQHPQSAKTAVSHNGEDQDAEWEKGRGASCDHWMRQCQPYTLKKRYAHEYISRSQVFIVVSVSETDFLIIAP